jgi:hypothetical protein
MRHMYALYQLSSREVEVSPRGAKNIHSECRSREAGLPGSAQKKCNIKMTWQMKEMCMVSERRFQPVSKRDSVTMVMPSQF